MHVAFARVVDEAEPERDVAGVGDRGQAVLEHAVRRGPEHQPGRHRGGDEAAQHHVGARPVARQRR